MHATVPSVRVAAERRTGLIVAAILAAAALAAAAVLLEPPMTAAASTGSQAATAAVLPVGSVGESAVAGDPSVPSAASVFEGQSRSPEEPIPAF
jgi:hypothetical protein